MTMTKDKDKNRDERVLNRELVKVRGKCRFRSAKMLPKYVLLTHLE